MKKKIKQKTKIRIEYLIGFLIILLTPLIFAPCLIYLFQALLSEINIWDIFAPGDFIVCVWELDLLGYMIYMAIRFGILKRKVTERYYPPRRTFRMLHRLGAFLRQQRDIELYDEYSLVLHRLACFVMMVLMILVLRYGPFVIFWIISQFYQ